MSALYAEVGLDDGSLSYLTTDAITLPTRIRQSLAFAFDCLRESVLHVKAAFSTLTASELHDLKTNSSKARSYFSIVDNLTASQESWLVNHSAVVAKLNRTNLTNGAILLADIARQLDTFLTSTDRASLSTNVVVDTKRTTTIGTNGETTYIADSMLIIDMGGDDIYENNAGGAQPRADIKCELAGLVELYCPIAAVIELGGDEIYAPSDLSKPGIAAANAGIGFIYDASGSERYWHSKYVGAGASGFGILWDLAGDDLYASTRPNGFETGVSLGAGSAGGLGLILDGGGDDNIWHGGPDSMGWGAHGGTGLFVNRGGRDVYNNTPANYRFQSIPEPLDRFISGPGLGMGEGGGIGILLDTEGDDSYACDDPVNYGCMGASTQGGFGALLDLEGSDYHYVNQTDGVPARAFFPLGIGGATFGGLGVVMDRGSGSDRYFGFARSIGYGSCLSIGLLLDEAGSDRYEETGDENTAIGYGRFGECDEELISPPGIGLLRDDGGVDTYIANYTPSFCGNRANDKVWIDGTLGVGLDSTGLCS